MVGISFLTSFILSLTVFPVTKSVKSGILSSIFFNLVLYTSLLTTSFFMTSLSLLKATVAGTSLSKSNWSKSDFKFANSTYLANCDISAYVQVFKFYFCSIIR